MRGLKEEIDSRRAARSERVYILASSREQAAMFARRWASKKRGRAIADAKYLESQKDVQGLAPDADVVHLPGAWLAAGYDDLCAYLAIKGIRMRAIPEQKVVR